MPINADPYYQPMTTHWVQLKVRVEIPAPEGMCVNPALKARSSIAQGEGCAAAETLGQEPR
jgi:hypothetical protein